jgi:outer membrane receptor protein involved in Fe transport
MLNPFQDLKPELTTAQEIGLEAKFLQNRIGFDLTLYNSNSKNQLFKRCVIASVRVEF